MKQVSCGLQSLLSLMATNMSFMETPIVVSEILIPYPSVLKRSFSALSMNRLLTGRFYNSVIGVPADISRMTIMILHKLPFRSFCFGTVLVQSVKISIPLSFRAAWQSSST